MITIAGAVKHPSPLGSGDHQEGVWSDNHTTVRPGSTVCISQGAYLFTGNHDFEDPHFRFFSRPITIEDGVWVGARATACPGSHLRCLAIVGAGLTWGARVNRP